MINFIRLPRFSACNIEKVREPGDETNNRVGIVVVGLIWKRVAEVIQKSISISYKITRYVEYTGRESGKVLYIELSQCLV